MKKSSRDSEEMKHFAQKVKFLDNPEIRGISPEQLLTMFPVQKTDHILDVGAGTGYNTIPAARMVEGMVYALDIDRKMLEIINSKVKKEKISNIKTLKGSINEISLPDNSINVVLASFVLHEVKQLSDSLQQIRQVLKPDGYFVCVEFEKKDNSSENHPRVASSTMKQKIINTGFKVIDNIYRTDNIYIIIAKK